MTEARCPNCVYFDNHKCRFNPPVYNPDRYAEAYIWPFVGDGDWCSKFKGKYTGTAWQPGDPILTEEERRILDRNA